MHGVGKQLMGSEMLRSDWFPALSDGLRRAGRPTVPHSEFTMAFYGDLFRPPGHALAVGDPMFTASDVADGFELDLLLAWWQHAADVDPAVPPATGSTTLARSPAPRRRHYGPCNAPGSSPMSRCGRSSSI
ncbi:hypothetical protein GA0115254_126579 [Streptomyces sp. Ncost-T10-10d]|nr:hypothetical protein GA0115254_126579 [Streptomyces sp. Ncost-T10-10d]